MIARPSFHPPVINGPINGGMTQGNEMVGLKAEPTPSTSRAKIPMTPPTKLAKIIGMKKMGLSMMGIPKIMGSLILKIFGMTATFLKALKRSDLAEYMDRARERVEPVPPI